MCLACYKPADKTLSKERLEIAFINNPDGAGYAFTTHDERLIVRKGFMTFEDFWKSFKENQEGHICLVHFRVASAGNKEAENCHPFLVTPNLAIIHNGTIQDYNEKDNPKSDTALFAENILEELARIAGPKFFLSPVLHYLILKTIGDSRMVFLDKDGDSAIINESKGIIEDGVWYSNDSFREVKKAKEESKSNKHIKDSTPFVNHKGSGGSQRYGYILARGDGNLLTFREIDREVKRRKAKLKILVGRGVIFKIALGNDGLPLDSQSTVEGAEGLELWLQNHPNAPQILDAEIVPEYAG